MSTLLEPNSSAASIRSLYAFYAQQQSWVSSQLTASHVPLNSPSPSPSTAFSSSSRSSSSSRRQRASKRPANTTFYFTKRLRRLRSKGARVTSPSPFHLRVALASRHALLSSHRSVVSITPRQTSPPVEKPSPVAASLLTMYQDMIADRMESCRRLEEMVLEAQTRPFLHPC